MSNFSDDYFENEIEENISNPVERLHRILTICRNSSEKDGIGSARRASQILAEALGVDEKPVELLKIYIVIQDARNFIELRSNERARKRSVELLDRITEVFHRRNILTDRWNIISDEIGSKLADLELVGNNLPEDPSFVNLNSEKRVKLLNIFQELEEEVIASELSRKVKHLILEKIIEIRSCINKYTVFGSEPIKRSASETCGALIFSGKSISEEDKKKPVFAKVIAVFGLVSAILINSIGEIEPILSSVEITDNYLIPKVKQIGEEPSDRLNPFMNQEVVIKEIEKLHRTLKKETKLLPPSKDLKVD